MEATHKAVLFATLAGICWGLGEVATKQVMASGTIGPFSVLLVRVAGALLPTIIVYAIAMYVIKAEPAQWWTMPTPIMLKLLLGTTLMAGFAGVLFFYLGLKFGEISVVKPIAFVLAPSIAVLVGWLFLKESMNWQRGIGVVMGLASVILIATSHKSHGPAHGPAQTPAPVAPAPQPPQ
jgi:drug/metabolite transporter (DMT)-like permease